MKKILLLALFSVIFASCGKEDENVKTITNLSGETWYETWVWFSNSEEGDLTGFDDSEKTVEIGKNITVSTDAEYFYVTFKDGSGKSKMSKRRLFTNNKATVNKSDLY
jgi:hypothetical protein